MSRPRGSVVVEIEGISGAGKSTLVRALSELAGAVDVAAEEAARGGPSWSVGELMRSLTTPLDAVDAAFLFCARTSGRARLAAELAAEPGGFVLTDRLRLSLYAQLRRAGLVPDTACELVGIACAARRAPVTVLLDVGHAEHRRRLACRGHEPMPEHEFTRLRGWLREAYERLVVTGMVVDTTGMTAEQVRTRVIEFLSRL